MRLFLTILISLFTLQISAEIYTWEDKNGVTHFSESKPETAVKKMKIIQTPEQPKVTTAPPTIDGKENVKQADIEKKLSEALLNQN